MPLFPFFLTLFLSSAALAAGETLCFTNQKEYAEQREKLPAILKKLPVHLITNNFLVKAVTSLDPGTNSVRFYFNASRGIEKAIEGNVRVCASENQIELLFDNGVKELIEIRGDTSIYVRNTITMQKVEPSQHKQISDAIIKQKESTASREVRTPTSPDQVYK